MMKKMRFRFCPTLKKKVFYVDEYHQSHLWIFQSMHPKLYQMLFLPQKSWLVSFFLFVGDVGFSRIAIHCCIDSGVQLFEQFLADKRTGTNTAASHPYSCIAFD